MNKYKVVGGEVGSENDPMLPALLRLRKKLERQGKKIGELKSGDINDKKKNPNPIKIQNKN